MMENLSATGLLGSDEIDNARLPSFRMLLVTGIAFACGGTASATDGRVARSVFADTLGYSQWRETLYGPPSR